MCVCMLCSLYRRNVYLHVCEEEEMHMDSSIQYMCIGVSRKASWRS